MHKLTVTHDGRLDGLLVAWTETDDGEHQTAKQMDHGTPQRFVQTMQAAARGLGLKFDVDIPSDHRSYDVLRRDGLIL